jgi:hypothetical protein
MTRLEAVEAGFELYGFCRPEFMAERKAFFEGLGYTTVELTEVIAGFPVLFLGTRMERPTRRERGLLC